MYMYIYILCIQTFIPKWIVEIVEIVDYGQPRMVM